ncbi:MAG TPA: hypothetical protein PLB18_04185 [Acidobacteriota bacterium]|nr:hypothetical protein [Acidobacteriota bacterium]HND18546.1 hypothetical protein [Acidobacteriota bacterium]
MRFIQVTGIIILSCLCYLSGSHPAMAQTQSKNTKKNGAATSQQIVPPSGLQTGPEHPTPSSLASLTVIQSPTDEVTIEEGKIYHLRVRPNFVCLVELPVLPEAILVGNPARFLVEPLPETSAQPVKTAPPSSRLLLVKPLKINDPAGDRLVTNLTIKLANGRVVSILLDNTDSETLTVYRCRFVDPTVPASQTQTSSTPQSVEPPVSFPEIQTRLRTFTDTSLQEHPASTVTNQFGTASFWVRREGQYVLAVLRITPASKFKKVVLTTPSWTLGETTVQPKFTQQPLPETMKKASVTGSFLFDLSESSEALQTTTGSSQPVLGVQMGVQTALISLQASPASVVDQTGPVGTDAKAFPMLSSPASESQREPSVGIPQRSDSPLTPAQQDQVQRLNQITSGTTGSISPVAYRSDESLPAERQSFSLAQERLDFLTQTIGIRSDQVKRVTVGEVLAGIYTEQFQGITLAIVCLERFRGSTPREISPLQWDTGGQVVTARAIFNPFPRTLTTVPLISGFIFDAPSISSDRFKCVFKVGNDSVKIQAGSELTQGSTDSTEKIFQAGSVEFSVSRLRLENIGPILRVKARNPGTQPIEKIELLVVTAGKASSGTQLAQLTQLDPIQSQIEPVSLRGTRSIDFRIPESLQPDQLEIRWAHQGTWTSVRVSFHSK